MIGVPGVVLAGGESRRMGRDKGLLPLAGRALAARTVERLAPQCGALAVSRHDGRLDGLHLGLPLLADGDIGRAGPLGGLLAGLDWAAGAAPGATHVVTVAVDSPFLPDDFVARLLAASGSGATVASSGGRRHPVAALWPIAARHALHAALFGEGLRRVGLFLDRLRPATVKWPTDPFDPFMNLNAPEDLAAAERVCARYRASREEPGRASRRCDDA